MTNNVYVVGPKGTSRMMFNNYWIAREAPKRGLRDPWAHRPDRLLNVKEIMTKLGDTGKEIKAYQSEYRDCTEEELAAWKIERDEYMRQRDEWIALKMFDTYGYETFLEECEAYGLTKEFAASVLPCGSQSDPQCSMFCSMYNCGCGGE